MGGNPANLAIRTIAVHGFILFVRLVELSEILCFMNMIITEARIVQ